MSRSYALFQACMYGANCWINQTLCNYFRSHHRFPWYGRYVFVSDELSATGQWFALYAFHEPFNPWFDVFAESNFAQWLFKPYSGRGWGVLSGDEKICRMTFSLHMYLLNWAQAREIIYVYYMLRDNIIVWLHGNALNSMYLRYKLWSWRMALFFNGIDEW